MVAARGWEKRGVRGLCFVCMEFQLEKMKFWRSMMTGCNNRVNILGGAGLVRAEHFCYVFLPQ